MADTTASRLIVEVKGEGVESTSASVGRLSKTTVAAAASVTLLGVAVGAVAKSAIKGAAALEQNQIALTTMLKSADKANKLLSDIRKMGAETPFETKDLIDAGSQLVAFGIQASDVVGKMKMIGDIAAGTGTPIKELAVLYGKARIAGTLYAEDLNMLMERKINIFGELEKITGKSTVAIKKMASNGKLSFKLLEKAFANMTNKGGIFAGLMAAQSKSLAGLWSTFKSLVEESATSLGTFFLPELKAVVGFLVEIAAGVYQWFQNTENLNSVLKTTAMVLKSIAIAAGIVASGFLAVFTIQKAMIAIGWIQYLWLMRAAILKNITLTNLWAGAQWLLNKALTANPIGLIIAGIAVLGTAIFLLIKNWDKVKFAFLDFSDTVRFNILSLAVEIRTKLIGSISSLVNQLSKFSSMAKIFKGLVDQQKLVTHALVLEALRVNKVRSARRAAFKESQAQKDADIKKQKTVEDKYKKTAKTINESGKTAKKTWLDMTNEIGNATINAFSAIGSAVQAFQQANIDALDRRMQKELEAAGVAEKTTFQQAQNEYDAAVTTGNALDIEEKRRALVKAQIEEKYQKKKRKLEYESASTAWGFQLAAATAQGALAVLNAYAAGAKINPIFGAIYAGIAGAAAGAQIAAVAAAKPPAPSAQFGGSYIVPPGSPGDSASVNVNSGERVDITPVSQSGGGKSDKMVLQIGDRDFEAYLVEKMNKIANSGKFNITRQNVVKFS
jgi:tape measure domain-containing protein